MDKRREAIENIKYWPIVRLNPSNFPSSTFKFSSFTRMDLSLENFVDMDKKILSWLANLQFHKVNKVIRNNIDSFKRENSSHLCLQFVIQSSMRLERPKVRYSFDYGDSCNLRLEWIPIFELKSRRKKSNRERVTINTVIKWPAQYENILLVRTFPIFYDFLQKSLKIFFILH